MKGVHLVCNNNSVLFPVAIKNPSIIIHIRIIQLVKFVITYCLAWFNISRTACSYYIYSKHNVID